MARQVDRLRTRERNAIRAAAFSLAALTSLLLFRPVAASLGMTPQARACGGTPESVVAEFDLDSAKNVWTVLPAMLRAPELEASDEPVHVVVFGDDLDVRAVTIGDGTEPAPIVHHAICVTPAGGAPILYTDVSRAGSAWQ